MNPFQNAAFVRAAARPADLPPSGAQDLVFAGRSNVGKSSAINAIAGRKQLARVSKTPGRTQTVNFYALGEGARLVDLPGYGYARVPHAMRAQWRVLVDAYLQSARALAALVVVMDARHPLTPLDLELLRWIEHAPRIVLLAKADKLSRTSQAAVLRAVCVRVPGDTVLLFSSVTGQGVEECRDLLQRRLHAGREE